MSVKDFIDKVDNVVNHLDLETQYVGFRVAYFLDLAIAFFFVLAGELQIGLLFAILAVGFGVISNQKKFLINQSEVLDRLSKPVVKASKPTGVGYPQ